ncbi:MAG: SU10 major capsid protein [Bacteroidales bacterium]
MTVLKSFELNGNKQSFANWISNMSPCDTPFTSMVGKEGINEVQYSWQTDSLAPADNTPYEEGSQAESQTRAATKVVHNFTSTLRKVVSISDTIAKLDTFGRNSEIAYQMGKSGKELKRDIEFMCLNNGPGQSGSPAVASRFSGFEHLCADVGVPDTDTGAVTTKLITVANLDGPWFRTSDVFDMTYNLYLSGSKANKIMFHPQHATSFSDFMSHNIETPLAYRMFDGLNDKFNSKVSRIRDPLGREYDLIPNRFMPKDKLYFFTESDWTQMILRQPAVSPLTKKGSSESYLLETEIGLRHKNPHASGVLTMAPSNLIIEWTEKPTPITWGLGITDSVEVKLSLRATGQPVVDETTVTWASSNPLVVTVNDATGETNGGKANTIIRGQRKGTAIITATCQDGHASYLVTVGDPNIKLTMSNNLVEKGKTVLAVAYVLKADGTPVAENTVVSFRAEPGNLVEMPAITNPTVQGTARVEVKALQTLGLVQMQAYIGEAKSNYARLEIVDKVEQLSFDVTRRLISLGINDSAKIRVRMADGSGAGIAGKIVTVGSTNPDVITLSHNEVTTEAGGEVDLVFTAKGLGTTQLVATFEQQSLGINVTVTEPHVRLDVGSPAHENVPFNMTATVTRSDGSNPGAGIGVTFVSEPPFTPLVNEVDTIDTGVATASYTPVGNSDLDITATIGAYRSNTEFVSVVAVP